MSNKKKSVNYGKFNAKVEKKKNVKVISVAAAFVVVAVIIVAYVFINANNKPVVGSADRSNGNRVAGDSVNPETSPVNESDGNNAVVDGAEVKEVVIVKSDITETAKFYPYIASDGTEMELLAFKASDGTIRTAFNTCQVCYDSGRGYYEQKGNVLVCQNCGNQFPADRVGIEVGGCNPVPIMDADKTEDDETITIAGDFIEQYTELFSRWKTS